MSVSNGVESSASMYLIAAIPAWLREAGIESCR